MTSPSIPYTQFKATGNASEYISKVLSSGRTQGDGHFSKQSEQLLNDITGCKGVVLTASGTDALEMAGILAGIHPGDEVIMPSFTFVSSANAIVLRGGIPIFVDIDPATLNIDPIGIKAAITARTKAIMPVHYAGIACNMDEILKLSKSHNLKIIEDAAHGIGATWNGQHLGTIGDFGALSFHETKNIVAGEGGALLINDPTLLDRAEVVRDKGTNRKKFIRGEVDRYTWVDIGSSFLPSELQSALLASQLEQLNIINSHRLGIWNHYHESLCDLEQKGLIQRPTIPSASHHNGHIYWILLPDADRREGLRTALYNQGIHATSHYEPLHLAPIAARFARSSPARLPVTETVVKTILRLPLFPHLSKNDADRVIKAVREYLLRA
jgi:dTDP-4-amino-4,6-dideoxygalactose transaminase